MLFDLRGAGRRRVVKVIFVSLALLMGGGLVLFGIGGGGAMPGGLLDAVSEGGGAGDTGAARFERIEREATTRARANPEDAAAWAAVARARFNLASAGENFDQAEGAFAEGGQAQLRAAGRAWERHLELAGERPDDRVASLMVQGFTALGDNARAATAQEVIAEQRESAGAYATLALLAYQANQTRKGDLARARALELTEPDMRESLKGQLDAAKQQAAGGAARADGAGAQDPPE